MSTPFSAFDRLAMARALELAAWGLETTDPNPRVGCVIARDTRIIAEGWHERAGEAHAEVAALKAAKEAVVGATAYVTLEPCSHYGRTPPCAKALIEARIGRVVFAVQDPNSRVSGQGAEALLRAGVVVESGLMETEAVELNVGYMKRMRQGLPWVRVKLGMSLDGRTALANGASQWITGPASREDVQHWRARSSAIMTGVGTVLADDPQVNVRRSGEKPRQPLRVVLDSRLRISPTAKLFSAEGPVLVMTAPGGNKAALAARGALIEEVPVQDGFADLHVVLERLARREVNELLIEAGATLAGRLLSARLADELLLYVAPKLLGPQARPLADLPQLSDLRQALGFRLVETKQLGEDLRLRLRPEGP
jgi:diaminohydroxyphosphoribosylaminopyrimidine deaminase / 5-amino-6-(5-phosphoribosylamino)uracil reductase